MRSNESTRIISTVKTCKALVVSILMPVLVATLRADTMLGNLRCKIIVVRVEPGGRLTQLGPVFRNSIHA